MRYLINARLVAASREFRFQKYVEDLGRQVGGDYSGSH